jgi:hypothetical protein
MKEAVREMLDDLPYALRDAGCLILAGIVVLIWLVIL